MGTTTASLHLLRPLGKRLKAAPAVEKAYAKLGYARCEPGQETGAKRVVVLDRADATYISVYDSDNTALDSGELRRLAVALSRSLKTVALVTTIYDSDSFELLLFHGGAQLDAIVSDAESHSGGLTFQPEDRRPQLWEALFLTYPYHMARRGGRLASPEHADHRSVLRRALQEAAALDSPLADIPLAAWCKAAGLDPSSALSRYDDFGSVPGGTRISCSCVAERIRRR